MQESDYRFLSEFTRGKRLPYSSYEESYITSLLTYKKNNAAALIVCLDALASSIADPDIETKNENTTMLLDEMAGFCINGLFGIGFFGVSVEDGMPVRVDSCGINITKQYRSVYRHMSREEYDRLSRVESMTLDQREDRKFRRYILKFKCALCSNLSTIIVENREALTRKGEFAMCLKFDQMFCEVAIQIRRNSENMQGFIMNDWALKKAFAELQRILEPYKQMLKRESSVAKIGDYTRTEMTPITTSDIREYQHNIDAQNPTRAWKTNQPQRPR